MPSQSGKRELLVGTAIAAMLSFLLSIGVVYGLNRYLGPVDDSSITGSFRHPPAD